MSDEMIALSRRAAACPKWRWMPGMLLADGAWRARVGEHWPWYAGAEVLPVLDDPATLGCLLALVREAWEPYGTSVSTHRYDGGEWSIRTLPLPTFPTEAEALVAALEAAP